MSEIELKPCPFCGAKAGLWLDTGKEYSVRCKRCDARMLASSAESAIRKWNHRSGSQTYKEYFDENFSQDAFPHLDRSSICRRSIFGEMEKETLCEIGDGDCEACWNEVMK